MRISDWSSDVCSSDLLRLGATGELFQQLADSLFGSIHLSHVATHGAVGIEPEKITGLEIYKARIASVFARFYTYTAERRCELKQLSTCRTVCVIIVDEPRSEERRVGKECVRTCRSRVSQEN